MLNWNGVSSKALAVALTLTLISGGISPLRADGRKGSSKNTTTTAAKGGTSTAAGNEVENENEAENEVENEPGGGGGGGNTGGGNTSGKNGGGGGAETRLRAKGSGPVAGGVVPELNGDFRIQGARTRLKGELENLSAASFAVSQPIGFCLQQGTINTVLAISNVVSEPTEGLVAEFGLDSQNGDTPPTVVTGSVLTAVPGEAVTLGGVCAGTPIASATF
jgi:hypothetical protein